MIGGFFENNLRPIAATSPVVVWQPVVALKAVPGLEVEVGVAAPWLRSWSAAAAAARRFGSGAPAQKIF